MKGFEAYMTKLKHLVDTQTDYKLEAYGFVMGALHFTLEGLKETRHVTGRELLDGIRRYGREQYGALTQTVFNYWGVRTTEDFGRIVFTLIDAGLMSKTDDDTLNDFRNVYDFDAAFAEPLEWAVDDSSS